MQLKTLRLCLLALAVLLGQAGCGFHLKGYQQASPNLDGLYIEQGSGRDNLAGAIHQQLLVSGVELATSAAQAKNVLRILRDRVSQRVISVDANGKVLEYELLLEASFSVAGSASQESPTPRNLELTRQLISSGSDELGRRREAEQMRHDMRTDMAGQIIRQLQALLR
jgi:LPS-assembly lipoprotein